MQSKLIIAAFSALALAVVGVALSAGPEPGPASSSITARAGLKTDTSKASIPLSAIESGGPPKDGIPAIDAPRFVSVKAATSWVAPREPVVLVEVGGVARGYPLQILTWHEIVNDTIAGTPVAVTFCPLCYAVTAFDRRVGGQETTFGVSGLLRHSDMLMYDRATESLWQQLIGEAVVGARTGTKLKTLPAQIVAFEQLAAAYPNAKILSRETGHSRRYGTNPYVGYDDIDRPFLFRGTPDGRLPAMSKVIAVSVGSDHVAYPHAITRKVGVIHDTVGGQPIVVLHAGSTRSALDTRKLSDGKALGTTGVFVPEVAGKRVTLRVSKTAGQFTDAETGSTWTSLGRATAGPHKGQQLRRVPLGDYYAFAWLAFRPDSRVYTLPAAPARP